MDELAIQELISSGHSDCIPSRQLVTAHHSKQNAFGNAHHLHETIFGGRDAEA
jgi:hypothetical protein